MRLFRKIAELFFVPKCIFCGKVIENGYICRNCRDRLPYVRSAIKGKEFYTKCSCAIYYKDTARNAMLRYKFGGKRIYSEEFSLLLAEAVVRDLDGEFDTVTWVPVSKKRERKRGYDQSRLIAERTAELLGYKAEPLLRKRRHTPAQSGIKAEDARRANVSGAYEITDRDRISGRKILLIDDIVTTGATFSECARVLLMAGAESVAGAAVCCAVRDKK